MFRTTAIVLLLTGVFGFVSAKVPRPVEGSLKSAPAQKLVSGAGLSDESGAQVGSESQSQAMALENVSRILPDEGEARGEDVAPPSNWLTYARRDGGSHSIYGSDQVGIRFKLSDFDCDTVTIDSVRAYFYCVGAGSPWSDTTVVLRIYDADADSELWNSGPLEVPVSGIGACSLKVALTEPIKTGRDFVMVSDPVAANGTPHVWGDDIQRFRSLDRSTLPGPWSVDSGTPTTYRLMACYSPRTSVPSPWPGARLLHETFESSSWPPSGWARTQSNSSYPWTRVTTSSNPAINGAFLYAFPPPVNPNYYYMIRMYSWLAPSGSWARIATPTLGVGASSAPVWTRFQFYQDPGAASKHDSLYVEVSTTSQTGPWVTVVGFDRQRSIAGWYETVVPLGVYSGNIWVSWRAVSKKGNNLVMDHPMVYYGREVDMGVSRLVGIQTEPRFVGDMDTFRIRVSNFGTSDQTGVYVVLDVDEDRVDSVAVDVNGGTFVDTLLRWRPAAGGSKNLRFFTKLSDDQDGSNDTLRRVDQVITTVTSFDEGFEGEAFPPPGWSVTDSNGVDGTWSRSSLRYHAGQAGARTSPDPGPYANGAHDVLYTPVCDLTGASIWRFSFWHLDSIEADFDSVYLEYATDVQPDAATPPAWSPLRGWSQSEPATWLEFDTLLRDGLTSRWRFRWRFKADNSIEREGTWVDDLRLVPVPANDLGVQSLLSVRSYPLTIDSAASFRIRIRNYGTDDQIAPVELLADGVVKARLPAVGPIPAFGTFDTALAWTPAATGPVRLKFCTVLSPDADPTNDTLELARYVNPASYVPDYAEDFNEAWEDANNPPWYGWRIVNGGSEYPPVQNRNDWIKYGGVYDAATTEGSGVPGGPTEAPNDSLISPRFDCSAPGTYTLTMWYDFYIWDAPDCMRVLLSTDDGGSWSVVHFTVVSERGLRAFDVTSLVAGEPNVRVAFVHVNTAPNGSPYNYWDVDWFTFTALPGAPTLTLPASGDTINQARPRFDWSESPYAVRYWIQVDDDPSFVSPEIDDSSSTSGSFTPATPLTEGRWFWRVAGSKDVAVWSPFGGPDSFWIDRTPPAAPVLWLPAGNAYLGTATPAFHWGAVTFNDRSPGDAVVPRSAADRGPVSYDIQVASDSTFPDASIVYARTLTDTFVTATTLPEARLFWRVRGRDGVGNIGEYADCRAFEIDLTAPDAPVLYAPANESYLNTCGPDFWWGQVGFLKGGKGDAVVPGRKTDNAPVTYRLEVALDSTFPDSSIVYAATPIDTCVSSLPLPEARLFWHVRGEDGAGNIGAYSAYWVFTVMVSPLVAPTLCLPANHSRSLTQWPQFVWNRINPGTDALISYRFQVATESLFNSPVINTRLAETTYAATAPLDYGKHYWRVMAKDTAGNISPYSTVFDVTVEPLPAPTLCLPANHSRSLTQRPQFVWNRVNPGTDALVSYRFQVATESLFNSPIINTTLAETTYAATAPLDYGSHYWRVMAKDTAGNISPYSAVFDVTVEPLPVPILRLPADHSWTLNRTPEFIWDRVDPGNGALIDYRLQVATDSLFTSPLVNTVLAETTYTPFLPLDFGRHYWRVMARDTAGNTGPYCPRWDFTVTEAATVGLTTPNGGEVWLAGSSHDITWTSANSNTDSILWSADNGLTWSFAGKQTPPTTRSFAWTVPGSFGSRNRIEVFALGNANTASDLSDTTFTILSPISDWTGRPALPAGSKNKNVKDGGALAYGREGVRSRGAGSGDRDDTGYVYAFKGNNRCEFYRYNTLSNIWVTRESIPAIGRLSKKKAVKKGSSLAMAGDGNIYATKGNNTLEWWQYDPVARKWTQKADVPTGAKNLKEGVGSAAVTIGSDDYVYLLRGSSTYDFYRYKVASDAWEVMPAAPGGVSTKPYKNGSSIAYDGNDTIYCLKGSYNEFAAHSVSGRNWVTKDPLPLTAPPGSKKKKVKDGSSTACAGKAVYALKGGNTNEFWTYRCDSHKWTVAIELPTGSKRVKGGGALVTAKDVHMLYAFRGNNTCEFWEYGPILTFVSLNPPEAGRPKGIQARVLASSLPYSLSIAPNPFTSSLNPSISYSLPVAGNVSVRLYDVTGKLVSTLASGYRPAGNYACRLAPAAYRLSAGVYVLSFEAEGCRTTQKLVIE